MDETKNHFRHAINIDSVGKPKENDKRGCYVMLNINDYSNVKVAESIGVEFIRFEYDVEKLQRPLKIGFCRMGMPYVEKGVLKKH